MSAEFPKILAGEKIMPEMSGYRMKCCDCGLVHRVEFGVVEVLHPNDDGTLATAEPDNADRLRVVLSMTREATTEERCESGDPDCGPVEFHDDDGVPLCRQCWGDLPTESKIERRMREAGFSLVATPGYVKP